MIETKYSFTQSCQKLGTVGLGYFSFNYNPAMLLRGLDMAYKWPRILSLLSIRVDVEDEKFGRVIFTIGSSWSNQSIRDVLTDRLYVHFHSNSLWTITCEVECNQRSTFLDIVLILCGLGSWRHERAKEQRTYTAGPVWVRYFFQSSPRPFKWFLFTNR